MAKAQSPVRKAVNRFTESALSYFSLAALLRGYIKHLTRQRHHLSSEHKISISCTHCSGSSCPDVAHAPTLICAMYHSKQLQKHCQDILYNVTSTTSLGSIIVQQIRTVARQPVVLAVALLGVI